MYVVLDAQDGHEFIIERKYAEESETIRLMQLCPPNATQAEGSFHYNCKIVP
jgi:hypothetical protein